MLFFWFSIIFILFFSFYITNIKKSYIIKNRIVYIQNILVLHYLFNALLFIIIINGNCFLI